MSAQDSRAVERLGGKLLYRGPIASVRMERFRYPDGKTADRQIVVHPGAVVIAAHDERVLYMVRQPREAVGETSLLELPAGKLDVDGESPLDCARRELAEEVGRAASDWRELKTFYASPGFSTERFHLFLATGLSRVARRPDLGERIEVVEVPLDEIEEAIDACEDAKSLVGLMLLRRVLV